MSKRVALHARISTDGQSVENQLRELRGVAERHNWQIVGKYVDRGISGAKGRQQRPQFNAVLNGVARKEFELVAAWSVCRLGRSLQHLISFLNELHAKKVDLYLHQEGIDTTTPAGRAMFSMLGVFGEFERSMIQACTSRIATSRRAGKGVRKADGKWRNREEGTCAPSEGTRDDQNS